MMSRGRPSGGDALLAVVFHGHPLHFVWRLVNGVCESALPPCPRGSPPDDSAHVHYFMARSACSSDSTRISAPKRGLILCLAQVFAKRIAP